VGARSINDACQHALKVLVAAHVAGERSSRYRVTLLEEERLAIEWAINPAGQIRSSARHAAQQPVGRPTDATQQRSGSATRPERSAVARSFVHEM
jgi:hypothetical protein